MNTRTIARLGASLAIVATLAGAALHSSSPVHAATPRAALAHAAPATCKGLPCIYYAYQTNTQGCIVCVQVLGRDMLSDPLLVSAIDSVTGQLVAQANTRASSRGGFRALLNVAQCTTDPLLISALDLQTGLTSNAVPLTLHCQGRP